MKSLPKFEDISGAPDVDVQRALMRVSEEILAAALLGAKAKVSDKIIANLSKKRREEVSAAAQKFPDRTREVARRVLVKMVFGIEDDETAAAADTPPKKERSARGKDLQSFLEKLSVRHPDFIEAKKQREQGLLAEHLRRLFEEE